MRLNIANVKYVASLNYFNRLFSSAAGDDGEPEHLHDPPFLKHIPHLWPGGGDGNDDYDEDDDDKCYYAEDEYDNIDST